MDAARVPAAPVVDAVGGAVVGTPRRIWEQNFRLEGSRVLAEALVCIRCCRGHGPNLAVEFVACDAGNPWASRREHYIYESDGLNY
jgi:hypothetical protein